MGSSFFGKSLMCKYNPFFGKSYVPEPDKWEHGQKVLFLIQVNEICSGNYYKANQKLGDKRTIGCCKNKKRSYV